MSLGRKMMWMVVGTATSRLVRGATRRALHNHAGRPKLPAKVRRSRDLGMAIALAAGASALMGFGDVLKEQGKDTARAT